MRQIHRRRVEPVAAEFKTTYYFENDQGLAWVRDDPRVVFWSRESGTSSAGRRSSPPDAERVFRWAIAQQPPLRPADVVIQDEYTHDVLFAAADGSWLVFDAT